MKTTGIKGLVVVMAVFTIVTAQAAPVDHVYVSNNRLDKLNFDGSLNMNFLAPGFATNCRQLAIDGNSGNVWLGCEGDNAVALFTSDGALINYVTGIGISGGACVDPLGNAWFTNSSANTVIKFGSGGNLINSYSVGGNSPTAVACDRLGNIWTTNSGSPFNTSKLANNGSLINTYSYGSNISIVVDSDNNILVTEGNRVRKLDNDGSNLGFFSANLPTRIAIDQIGNIWVSSAVNNMVTKFSNTGTNLGNFTVPYAYDISIDTSGNIWVVQRTTSTITKLSNGGAILGTFPLSGNSGQNDTGFLYQRFVLGFNSVEGSNVWVPLNGGAPAGAVTLNFSNITGKGNTSYTQSGTGTPPPSGFRLGSSPRYYDITSTTTHTGNIEVCIGYDLAEFNNEAALRLFHNDGTWTDVTSTVDTTNNIVCGVVTNFSEFAVMEADNVTPTVSEWVLILLAAALFIAIAHRFKKTASFGNIKG